MSRRHTNLADVPSGVSQIIIKLSFGSVKKETFYGRFGFPARDGSLPAEGPHQSKRRPRKEAASLPDTLGTSEASLLQTFPSADRKAAPARQSPRSLTHSMKLSMKEACYFRQFKISPL